jgi:hypothetical protein
MGSANPVPKDRTAAQRQRRHRERRKLQKAGVTVTPASVVTMPPSALSRSRSLSIVPCLTLLAALAVAGVSGAFSIIGLTAVFTGAFWPVVGMGAALECAKLSAVTWLGRRYAASRWLKGAIVTLVVTLMGLSSIGSYGFLARAHLAHVTAGEATIASHAADVDARKEVAAANLADVDRRIAQVDAAVAESTRRGRTVAAMALAEQQTDRRDALVAERTRAANALATIQSQSAEIENERNALTANNGPVEYLSKLIGADRDAVMRVFVAFVSLILEPLAPCLLLAANAPD